MAGLRLLQLGGVAFNTMSTVNKYSEGRGLEVYQFLKSLGSRYMQFMPVVEHVRYPVDKKGKPVKSARPFIVNPSTEGAQLAPWSVSDIGFGRFMCDIFDEWVRNDVGSCFVNLFDATLANWCGVMPGTCAYAKACGGNSVIEHNGDLYPCDHFVYPEYRLGNIQDQDIRTMMESDRQVRFGTDKRSSLPSRPQRPVPGVFPVLFPCGQIHGHHALPARAAARPGGDHAPVPPGVVEVTLRGFIPDPAAGRRGPVRSRWPAFTDVSGEAASHKRASATPIPPGRR